MLQKTEMHQSYDKNIWDNNNIKRIIDIMKELMNTTKFVLLRWFMFQQTC